MLWIRHALRMSAIALLILGGHLPAGAETNDPLSADWSLENAEAAALAADPSFQALQLARERHDALIVQAGLGPNPELEVEIEEFGGTGDFSGIDALASSIRYTQSLEPKERREARIALARAEQALFAAEAEAIRYEIRAEVQREVVEVLAAREALRLREEELLLAQESQGVADIRVEAGQVAPLEATRVRIDLLGAQASVAAAALELDSALERLRLLIAMPSLTSDAIQGALTLPSAPPEREALAPLLDSHPLIQRWQLEAAMREAAVTVEQAENLRDLSWSAGLLHSNESNDVALMAGVSWEWPRKNRNQGAILAAELDLARIEPERAGQELALRAALEAAYQGMVLAHSEAERIATQILPVIDEVLALTQEAYRAGKVGILEVLDAQRALIEARSQHQDAVRRYHLAAADVRALTGWNALAAVSEGEAR